MTSHSARSPPGTKRKTSPIWELQRAESGSRGFLGKGFLDKSLRKWAAQEVGFSHEGAQLSMKLDQDQGPEG